MSGQESHSLLRKVVVPQIGVVVQERQCCCSRSWLVVEDPFFPAVLLLFYAYNYPEVSWSVLPLFRSFMSRVNYGILVVRVRNQCPTRMVCFVRVSITGKR